MARSHKLVILLYKLTDMFPTKEQFSLTDQMRQAAVSVTSNIAEGFGRIGKKEKIQFYYMSQGSLTELQNQLIISRDLNYINRKEFDEIANLTILVHKLLSGLIKSVKNK